ncbi:helix-turn-helix domain-containing protein [Nocardia barduliensis]|uniref:helix-turn-helix domain-containing protein n=1 Tax=Nocardia barduliensis TaxID=2736643 RepID=UPI0015731C7E|nr:helix-turn-helix transcriptional regulator [Nocardia barduliensis]
MRDALATWHMGRVIFAYRQHPHHGRTLPQELVAHWLGLTQAQLSRIEKGAAPEQLSKLAQWSTALGVPPDLLWFKVREQTTAETKATDFQDDEADVRLARWLLRDAASPLPTSTRGDELQRVALAIDDASRYFDGSVVEFLRGELAVCKQKDGVHGPAAALPLTLGVLAVIRRHSKDVKSAVRQSLLSLGADGAEFVGWLYRDLRRPVAAGYWYDRAIEMAQEASDLSMQGYLLLRKSQMAYDNRDNLRVLTFAQAASRGPWRLPTAVQAEITQQEARGLAMQGEPFNQVERKLDEARQLHDTRTDDHEPAVGLGYDQHTHLLRSASCYIEAGKPAKAASLYGIVLADGGLSDRDEGYFRARRAVALALSGEPDDAADEGLLAMRRAAEKQSARTKKELARAVEAMGRWQHRPGPRELREALTADAATRQATPARSR